MDTLIEHNILILSFEKTLSKVQGMVLFRKKFKNPRQEIQSIEEA